MSNHNAAPANGGTAYPLLGRLLRRLFGSTPAIYGTGMSPAGSSRKARRPARVHSDYQLEAIEPRVLLSADLGFAHGSDVGATNLTLKAVDSGGLFVKLVQTANPATEVASAALTGAGDLTLNISSGTFGALYKDTLTIDLGTFGLLNTFAGTHGGVLDIGFTGDSNLLFGDSVVLSGSGTLGYDFKLHTDAAISLPAGASLTTAGDVTLASADTSSGLPPVDGKKFFADSSASLSVLGTLSGHDVRLSAASDIDVDNTSLGLGGLQFAFIYAASSAQVDIAGNAHVTATGLLDVKAGSAVTANANLSSLSGKTDAKTDAAVASVLVTSDAIARVGGSAQLSVTGAFNLSAANRSLAAALADGSAGGAGATLGVAVIGTTHANLTEASVGGGAIVGASSVGLHADAQNTLTALAKSTPKGATESGTANDTDSKKALTDNDASTSEGKVDLAGAVAVGTVNSDTKAFVASSGAVTTAGALSISSNAVTSAATSADGSSTVADGAANNVGIAVAIGVDVLRNNSWIGGAGTVTAGSAVVEAKMADRSLAFKSADADTAADTISIESGAHGLKTGDEVVYAKGAAANTAIGGLTAGATYFAVVDSDGAVKLSDSAAHAKAGTNLVDLTAGSSGSGHTLTSRTHVDRLSTSALAGASGGTTAIAGALALSVAVTDTTATVADGTHVVVTGGGSVALTAESEVESRVKASGKQDDGTTTGVGAAVALNIGVNTTLARIGDSATVAGAGDITLAATGSNTLETRALGGSAGKTAVTPVIAITVANNDTAATLGTQTGALGLAGSLSLSAVNAGNTDTVAEGGTESGGTGVGISLALTIATDSAVASTARNAGAGGAMAFKSRSTGANKSNAKASVAGGSEGDKPAAGSADEGEGGVNKKVASQRGFADGKAGSHGASGQDRQHRRRQGRGRRRPEDPGRRRGRGDGRAVAVAVDDSRRPHPDRRHRFGRRQRARRVGQQHRCRGHRRRQHDDQPDDSVRRRDEGRCRGRHRRRRHRAAA